MINYDNILNKKVREVKPSGIRKFFDIAEQMEDVISLGVGEPDFQTPWQIRQAGIRSLENGRTKYTSNWGLIQLRNEIARYVKRKYNLSYDQEHEILVFGDKCANNSSFVSLNSFSALVSIITGTPPHKATAGS